MLRWYPSLDQLDADEGWMLTQAWQISQGLVPYRDFSDFHTPGAFYLLAAVFKILGPSYLAARLLTVLLTLATTVVLDRLTKIFTQNIWHRISVLALWWAFLCMYPLLTPNHYANLASIWATYLLVAAWRQRRAGWYFSAGLAAGVTVWMVQTRGAAVMAAGLFVIVASRRWQILRAYAAGLLVAALPFLVWSPVELVRNVVFSPLSQYPQQFYSPPYLLIQTIGVIAGIGLLAWLVRLQAPGFWPFWLSAFLLAASIWVRADVVYLAMVMWPIPVLFITCMVSPWKITLRPRGQRVTKIVLVYVGCLLAAQWIGWATINASAGLALQRELVQRGPFLAAVVAEVKSRTQPGEAIFVTPNSPGVYFFSDRPNATRFNALFGTDPGAPFFAEAIADLERTRPRIVVRVPNSFVVRRGFHRDGSPVDQYLDAHYRVAQSQIGDYAVQILERNPETPE